MDISTSSKNQTLSLHRNQSSPMFRLGAALQNIDRRDQKALKFMELAKGQKLQE